MLKSHCPDRLRTQGITSISNPNDISFTNISPQFLSKHGRIKCPCCKLNGVEKIVEIAPAIRGSTRKDAAVCREHEQHGRDILHSLWLESRHDYSEANATLRF